MSKAIKKTTKDKQAGARKAIMEELFQDFNSSRAEVYRINFVRGLFFGLGSALGGTVILALVIWLLSLFTDLIPGVHFLLDAAKDAK